MSTDLFEATVGNFKQGLSGLAAVLGLARAHYSAEHAALAAAADVSLHPTMKPLRFQVSSAVHYSVGALASLRYGTSRPPPPAPLGDLDVLIALVEQAGTVVGSMVPEELGRLASTTVVFTAPGRRRSFTGRLFLLSFAVPNFYFHVTTAYDILRAQGVALQKRDFLGPVRSLADG